MVIEASAPENIWYYIENTERSPNNNLHGHYHRKYVEDVGPIAKYFTCYIRNTYYLMNVKQ